MKRHPLWDPPEYVRWTPDAALLDHYDATLQREPDRQRLVAALDAATLLALYAGLVRVRLYDITLARWVRTGVIAKAWLATGEEAATVGPVHALDPARDLVVPLIRNIGAAAEFGAGLAPALRTYLGTPDAPTRGRDLHHGAWSHRVLPHISHLGVMVPVAAGVALAARVRRTANARTANEPAAGPPVVLTWIGDGTSRTGPAHEGLNFAAVQRVPAVFILQNNQVALGTATERHFAGDFADLPASYGMTGAVFDGNHVLDAWAATRLAVERCRAGEGPVLLVTATFRMGGHSTHDGREAREAFPDAFAAWGRRDPIGLYEQWLMRQGFDAARLAAVEADVEAEVAAAEAEALASRGRVHVVPADALDGLYAE